MKITGSRSSRIRELYTKAVKEAKTSGTQFSKAVDAARTTDGKVGKASEKSGAKATQGAQYGDLLAKVDAKTEEFAIQTVARAPDVREAKVNAIRDAIKNGTYKVDADAVAERLLASGLFDDITSE